MKSNMVLEENVMGMFDIRVSRLIDCDSEKEILTEIKFKNICPECQKRLCSRFTNYCPNCGTKINVEDRKNGTQ